MNEVQLLLYLLAVTGGGGGGFMMGRMPIRPYSAIKWIAVGFALVLTALAAYVWIARGEFPWLLPVVAPWATGVIIGSVAGKAKCSKCCKCVSV